MTLLSLLDAPERTGRVYVHRMKQAYQLVKKVPLGFFVRLLSELQNGFLQYYFAFLPLRREMERERQP